MMNLRTLLIVLCVFGYFGAYSQRTVLDSLKNNITNATSDSEMLRAGIAFCSEWESFRYDTLYKYALLVDSLATKGKNDTAELYAQYFFCVWLMQTSKLDTALIKTNELLTKAKKTLPFGDFQIRLYKLRGNILSRGNKPNDLAASAFELLKLSEENNDTTGMIAANTGIGNAYFKMGKLEDATSWHRKAIDLMLSPYLRQKMCFVYLNLAVVFINRNMLDSCEHYCKLAIQYAAQRNDITDEANAWSFYGVLLSEMKRIKDAEAALKKSLELQDKNGDVYFKIAALCSLAEFYVNTNQPQKAIDEELYALAITRQNGAPFQQMIEVYDYLATAYKEAGNYKGLAEVLTLNSALKDSMYAANPKEAIRELETKYDVQKKENIIIQQKLDIASKKNSIYVAFIISGLLLIGLVLLIRYYNRRQKWQKQERALAISQAEDAERKRISADLHDNLGAYAAAAASTIRLIDPENIQGSRATLDRLKDTVQEMITQLQDSVWAMNKKSVHVTAVSDRFKLFIRKVGHAYPDIIINLTENIDEDRLLSPFQGLNLFRTMQEALNNALKHSRCENIQIIIVSTPQSFLITIEDDGVGMPSTRGSGHGINNLQERAHNSGWKVLWVKNSSGGTTVRISEEI